MPKIHGQSYIMPPAICSPTPEHEDTLERLMRQTNRWAEFTLALMPERRSPFRDWLRRAQARGLDLVNLIDSEFDFYPDRPTMRSLLFDVYLRSEFGAERREPQLPPSLTA